MRILASGCGNNKEVSKDGEGGGRRKSHLGPRTGPVSQMCWGQLCLGHMVVAD